jgi:hypothetical protein
LFVLLFCVLCFVCRGLVHAWPSLEPWPPQSISLLLMQVTPGPGLMAMWLYPKLLKGNEIWDKRERCVGFGKEKG